MIEVTFDFKRVNTALEHLADSAANPRPLMLSIGEELLRSTRARFHSLTGPNGEEWAKNKPSTIRRKGRDQPLFDHGDLFREFHYEWTGDALILGNSMEYSAIQQFGGDIEHAARSQKAHFKVDFNSGRSRFAKRSKANFEQWITRGAHTTTIPARPFLGISAEDAVMIEQAVNDYLLGSI